MRVLQVEYPKCGVSPHFQCRGVWAMGELHRLGEVGLAPSGGRPAKPHGRSAGWSGLHQLSPQPCPSTPCVDTCPQSHRPNRHKTWPTGRPLGPFGLGFGPLGPCIKYTPMVMMILTFCQFYCYPLKCSNLVSKFLKSNKH
jgi:hypothetical protein